MKFKNENDKIRFYLEVNRLDLISEEAVPDPVAELFLKQRKSLISKMRDFRKSTVQKRNWAQNRFKIMQGIKSFHRSIQGKKFHRNLGRFISSRIFKDRKPGYESVDCHLKAVSSLRTHIYIENEYYKPLEEAIDYMDFMRYAIPHLNEIEIDLFNEGGDLSEEQFELLLAVVDDQELLKAIGLCESITQYTRFEKWEAAAKKKKYTIENEMSLVLAFKGSSRNKDNVVGMWIKPQDTGWIEFS